MKKVVQSVFSDDEIKVMLHYINNIICEKRKMNSFVNFVNFKESWEFTTKLDKYLEIQKEAKGLVPISPIRLDMPIDNSAGTFFKQNPEFIKIMPENIIHKITMLVI